MALTLPWNDPTGVPAMEHAYLVWASLAIEPTTQSMRATFLVYRDRAAFDAGKRPVGPVDYVLAGTAYDTFVAAHAETAEAIRLLVYDFAKAQPDLAGAVEADA